MLQILPVQGIPVVVAEVLVRLFFYFRYRNVEASDSAKKHKLKALTVAQDTLGGTVFTFPRSKIVMTSPMDLPMYGKVKLSTFNRCAGNLACGFINQKAIRKGAVHDGPGVG